MMGKVNMSRVILGGLVAGLVINIVEYLLHGVILAEQWKSVMGSLNRPATDPSGSQITSFLILGFVIGMFMVWLYAAIRPRYGAGPRTAVTAGVAVWIVGYLLAMVGPVVQGIYPGDLVIKAVAVGFVEAILAAVAGAAVYKEDATNTPKMAAAGAR